MSIQTPGEPRTEVVAIHLTPGKLNAVRAAFKAGVKPSQIARQFGLSQSDVRKALAIDAWLLDVGLPSDLGGSSRSSGMTRSQGGIVHSLRPARVRMLPALPTDVRS